MRLQTAHKYKPERSTVNIPFGWRIANARKDAGLTQTELGLRVGVDQGTVSKWENGRLEMSLHDVVAVARATGKYGILEYYCNACPVCKAKKNSTPKDAA